MSEVQKALGVGSTITIEGKNYEFVPFKWKLKARFQDWVHGQAWRKVEKTKAFTDPVTYKERYDAMTALIGSEYYHAGNPGFQMALQSLEGQIYRTFLQLQPKNPNVTLEQVESWFESNYDTEILARIAEMDRDPNAEKVAATESQPPLLPSVQSSPVNPGA